PSNLQVALGKVCDNSTPSRSQIVAFPLVRGLHPDEHLSIDASSTTLEQGNAVFLKHQSTLRSGLRLWFALARSLENQMTRLEFYLNIRFSVQSTYQVPDPQLELACEKSV